MKVMPTYDPCCIRPETKTSNPEQLLYKTPITKTLNKKQNHNSQQTNKKE